MGTQTTKLEARLKNEAQTDRLAAILPALRPHIVYLLVRLTSDRVGSENEQLIRLSLLFNLLRQLPEFPADHLQLQLDPGRAWDVALAGLAALKSLPSFLDLVAGGLITGNALVRISTPLFFSAVRQSSALTVLRLENLDFTDATGHNHPPVHEGKVGDPTRFLDLLATLPSLMTLGITKCKIPPFQQRATLNFPTLRVLRIVEPLAPFEWLDLLLLRARHTLRLLSLSTRSATLKPIQLPLIALASLSALEHLTLSGCFAEARWSTVFADSTVVRLALHPDKGAPLALATIEAYGRLLDSASTSTSSRPLPNLTSVCVASFSSDDVLSELLAKYKALGEVFKGGRAEGGLAISGLATCESHRHLLELHEAYAEDVPVVEGDEDGEAQQDEQADGDGDGDGEGGGATEGSEQSESQDSNHPF